jgi:hypothetical protein
VARWALVRKDATGTTVDLRSFWNHVLADARTRDPEGDVGFQNGPAVLHDHIPVGGRANAGNYRFAASTDYAGSTWPLVMVAAREPLQLPIRTTGFQHRSQTTYLVFHSKSGSTGAIRRPDWPRPNPSGFTPRQGARSARPRVERTVTTPRSDFFGLGRFDPS